MIFLRRLLSTATLALPLLARTAAACPAVPPGLYQTTPATGSSIPANGAIDFSGASLSFDQLKVSVSGVPDLTVTLRTAHDKYPALFPENPSTTVASSYFFLDPPPPAGTMVTIGGNFCTGSPISDKCQTMVSFTTLAPDTTAPATPAVHFDRLGYTKVDGSTCSVSSDRTYWLHLSSPLAAADAAFLLYFIEEFSDASLTTTLSSGLTIAQAEETILPFPLLSTAPGSPTADPCFRITTFDAAGNQAPAVILTCDPCHARTTPGPSPEPMWTDADILPGGSCDLSHGGAGGTAGGPGGAGGTAGVGEGGASGNAGLGGGGPALAPIEPDEASGCGCRAAGRSPPAWGGLGLAVALLAAQRRRSSRRSPNAAGVAD